MQPELLNIKNIKKRSCFKCGYEAYTAEKKCPQCGRPLKTILQIRVIGGILVFLGGFLILFMGGISLFVLNIVSQGGKPGGGSHFTGSRNDLILIFGVFGAVIFFGFVALLAGLWQLILGRRNKVFIWLILGLGFLFVIGAILISTFLGR